MNALLGGEGVDLELQIGPLGGKPVSLVTVHLGLAGGRWAAVITWSLASWSASVTARRRSSASCAACLAAWAVSAGAGSPWNSAYVWAR